MPWRGEWFGPLAAVLAFGLVAGCATTAPRVAEDAKGAKLGANAEIVLLAPDVLVYELPTSGVPVLRRDWTEQALRNIERALGAELKRRGARFRVALRPPEGDQDRARQYWLLNRRLAETLVDPNLRLPHKRGKLDWTVGPGVRILDPDARYALFMLVRDSYSSDARKAMMIAGLFLGVNVPLGQQFVYVHLIDLEDGSVVWTNRLLSMGGDLRSPGPADEVVRKVLNKAPL